MLNSRISAFTNKLQFKEVNHNSVDRDQLNRYNALFVAFFD